MKQTVAIGIQDFEEIRKNQYFYIDKTAFIKEWWENGDNTTLITRPRRFGKTLNLSMLEKFFSIKYANRGELFEGLFIWQKEEYQQLQGTYPVISLSFASIKETTYEKAKLKIYELIKNLYSEYEFLLESDKLSRHSKNFMHQILEQIEEVKATMAIHQLAKCLYEHYGKKVIILLDEYDTPMQEAYVNGYWEELVAFTRSLFNATFKTNVYLERAIMTGITRVSKESIFSDLNHLKVVTTTSNDYVTSFGFTEDEVFEALEFFCLGEEKEEVKEWYDGFTFGNYCDIYNPWSVLNFLDSRKYGTYWANTSSNRLVGKVIREGNSQVKEVFEQLLQGLTIKYPIEEQILYNQLEENEDAIWSLLVASGYLKVVSYERMELVGFKEVLYELQLTNYEVKRMFYSMVRDWFTPAKREYSNFVKAMLQDDIEAMNLFMNDMTMELFSYFDTGKRKSRVQPERFYHGFVLGLLVELTGEYCLTSNRESGFGRYDIMLEPIDKKKNAIIIEFKVRNPKKESSLEKTVEIALEQIEEKKYETELIVKGFAKEQIKKYGFAFEGKEVLIG